MATILNDEYAEFRVKDEDVGGMDPKLEDQFAGLKNVAMQSLRGRKPFYDFHTSNKSFIELHNDLKVLGVKNNKFFLRIYDRSLMGLNVYDLLRPPIELQLKIFLECMINPWYWLREVCRIPQPGSEIGPGGGSQYKIDRNNVACWYLFLNGFDFYQSKTRQSGKTQDNIARFDYAFLFGALSSNILFFNKDKSQCVENLNRLKDQRDCLPEWMQMRMVITEDGKLDKGVDNVNSILNPVTKNRIIVMGSAPNKDGAIRLGRGATSPLQYFDEFDFFPFNTEVINASVFAYSKASDVAKRTGSLTSRAFSSTPLI